MRKKLSALLVAIFIITGSIALTASTSFAMSPDGSWIPSEYGRAGNELLVGDLDTYRVHTRECTRQNYCITYFDARCELDPVWEPCPYCLPEIYRARKAGEISISVSIIPSSDEAGDKERSDAGNTPTQAIINNLAVSAAKSWLAYKTYSHDELVKRLENDGFSNKDAIYGAENCGADWYAHAISSAKAWLIYKSFSHSKLVERLEYDGYTNKEAVYGADNSGADWFAQALITAKEWLSYRTFSYSELVERLEYDGFTHDQAVYGARNAKYNVVSININKSKSTTEQLMAVETAKSYLRSAAFSRVGLIDQLEYEGFTYDQAVYGVDNSGANWSAQAAAKAKSYLNYISISRTGLINQLEYDGFTNEQAVYGVNNIQADWYAQAVAKAKSYLNFSSFSRTGLIWQLEYEGFTHDQAVYGTDVVLGIIPGVSQTSNNTQVKTYIINTQTYKFHLPSCSFIPTINIRTINTSHDKMIQSGYLLCEHCKP